jgi:hypothetical protein
LGKSQCRKIPCCAGDSSCALLLLLFYIPLSYPLHKYGFTFRSATLEGVQNSIDVRIEITESVLASLVVASMIPSFWLTVFESFVKPEAVSKRHHVSECNFKFTYDNVASITCKVGTRVRSGRLTDNNAAPLRAGGLRLWGAYRQTGTPLKAALGCDNAVVEVVLPFRTRRLHPSQSPGCSPRHCVKYLTCRTVEL